MFLSIVMKKEENSNSNNWPINKKMYKLKVVEVLRKIRSKLIKDQQGSLWNRQAVL